MVNYNFGKIRGVDSVTYGPNPLRWNGYMISNPTAEQYLAAGYKPVTHTQRPETGDYEPYYTDEGANILERWRPLGENT